MARLTVIYKLNNKLYIGVLKGTQVDYFDRLMVNEKEFSDNVLYIVMIDESSNIVEVDAVPYNFANVDEEDFVILANNAIRYFKSNATFH